MTRASFRSCATRCASSIGADLPRSCAARPDAAPRTIDRMKALFAAFAASVLVSLAAGAQTGKTAGKPSPATTAGLQVSTGSAAPKGGTEAKVEDMRVLEGASTDPFELERLGLAAVNANQLDRAGVSSDTTHSPRFAMEGPYSG